MKILITKQFQNQEAFKIIQEEYLSGISLVTLVQFVTNVSIKRMS